MHGRSDKQTGNYREQTIKQIGQNVSSEFR